MYPSIAETAVFDVEEVWEDVGDVWFTVYNEYTDIREFAIGNNSAIHAGYWHRDLPGDAPPTAYLTVGTIAENSDDGWRVDDEGGYI